MKMFIVLSIAVLFSCSIDYPYSVELVIAEEHPFEKMARSDMWYTLRYFNGKEIRTMHISKGTRRVSVQVYTGGLCVFEMIGLGTLGSIGGFSEGDRTVYLRGEDGSFASMLIRASEYRRDAVSRLSVKKLKSLHPHLGDINEVDFMEKLFAGTLSESEISVFEEKGIMFDTIPKGDWISERYSVRSFSVQFSSRPVYISLRPGVYRYACWVSKLLLTIAVDENWESYAHVTKLESW